MTMNLKFELPSNKNGKSILNRPWMMNLCPNPKRGDGRETSDDDEAPWMAGMLHLPRLFVYHCEAEAGSKQSETLKVMERRLLRAIVNPAMIRDSEPGQGPQFGLLRPLKWPGSALVSP